MKGPSDWTLLQTFSSSALRFSAAAFSLAAASACAFASAWASSANFFLAAASASAKAAARFFRASSSALATYVEINLCESREPPRRRRIYGDNAASMAWAA